MTMAESAHGIFHLSNFSCFFLRKKICHDVFVQVPWYGELRLEFQFFTVFKLEACAISEERGDLDRIMFFVADNTIKNICDDMAIDCTGDEVPYCAVCSQ